MCSLYVNLSRACFSFSVQDLLAVLMDALHDLRVLEREYHQPLQEKLAMAKPLMTRVEMNAVFQGTEELEFVLDGALTYTQVRALFLLYM